MFKNPSLALGDPLGGLGNLRGDFGWHQQDAVFIGMDHGARLDRQPAHSDRGTKINQMHIGMGDTNAAREKMETDRSDFIKVPDVAVRDAASATEAPVDS